MTFDWNLDNILTHDPQILPNSLLKSEDLAAETDDLDSYVNIDMSKYQNVMAPLQQQQQAFLALPQPHISPMQQSGLPYSMGTGAISSVSNKLSGLVSEGFTSRFKWRPSSANDFGQIKCKVTNEIGSTECTYEIKLGGVPNPPTDCTHTLKNTSAIISCQVGFHQGDPDIYCYLLRKSENGVYKEHTRNRESCSFIVNEVNVNKLNEFWVYSSNKHGHNKDLGVYLAIGEVPKGES